VAVNATGTIENEEHAERCLHVGAQEACSQRAPCARNDLLTTWHGAQAADVKMGAINIRSDGASPDEVMAAFSRAEQEEVRALLSAPLAPERGRISPDLCHSHAPTHTTAPSTS
jgi:hypothetical protein